MVNIFTIDVTKGISTININSNSPNIVSVWDFASNKLSNKILNSRD